MFFGLSPLLQSSAMLFATVSFCLFTWSLVPRGWRVPAHYMVVPDHFKDHMVRLYGMGERLLVKTGRGVHMLHLKFRPENMFWLHNPKAHFVLLGPAQCNTVYSECFRRCARLLPACFPIPPKKILKTIVCGGSTSLQSWAVPWKIVVLYPV